ncbi:MAG: two-component sensor histidine kinase [Planctomycetales bacterium]|nr:two-component sensor histidine kinase [Planctomycetales bacterium]
MAGEHQLDSDERQQLQARYAEIATLAGGLAHEIKNPLSTISMNLELLVEDLANSEAQRDRRMLKKIQTVQRECRHLEDILNEFLKFARVGQLNLTDADLNEVVQEFIDFYRPEAEQHQIEISPHLGGNLPPVRLDRALFRQVLMNLALNAQQAMPRGGQLELQTSLRDGSVHLELIDTGTGMDPKTMARMFDVFFSTKPGGSGLGLPTVKKIIESHGGRISSDSEPGRGSRFTISLPGQLLSLRGQ